MYDWIMKIYYILIPNFGFFAVSSDRILWDMVPSRKIVTRVSSRLFFYLASCVPFSLSAAFKKLSVTRIISKKSSLAFFINFFRGSPLGLLNYSLFVFQSLSR